MTLYATNGIIVRLPKRVSIYLVDTVYTSLNSELDSIISELNTLLDTNLVISRTRNIANATLKVYLTDRNTYQMTLPSYIILTGDNVGFANLNWGSNGEIYAGSAFVDMVTLTTDNNLQRHVIHHELMHTLGLLGHVTSREFNSVLFAQPNFPYPVIYTSFDKKMMKLLYNPAIKPGMNEAEFNALVVNL